MTEPRPPAFAAVPHTVANHFALHVYAAVYALLNHLRALDPDHAIQELMDRYPFLRSYFGEILTYMPRELTWEDGAAWWEQALALWEAEGPIHLPLCALANTLDVDFMGRIGLILAGLVEEDARFGQLFDHVQAPLAAQRPTVSLLEQLALAAGDEAGRHGRSGTQRLVAAGLLLALNPDAPRAGWIVRVPLPIWDTLRGGVDALSVPWAIFSAAESACHPADLPFPAGFIDQVAALPALLASGRVTAIILRGSPGSDRSRVAASVARGLGRHTLAVDGRLLAQPGTGPALATQLGVLCALARAIPLIRLDLDPGEAVEPVSLEPYRGASVFLLGEEGGVRVEEAVTLTMPLLGAPERRRLWQQGLAGQPIDDLESISQQVYLPARRIRQVARLAVARAALHTRASVCLNDVREACRELSRQLLDSLATHLPAYGTWSQLVVNGETVGRLYELERRCRHRERLNAYLGGALGATYNRGVRALFAGASGTGKTIAARILAAELGMDLYRVDLAAVVNKYIGETEKNLHRILSRAEEMDVILLFDEGDALLGSRTEVRSANDRYANLETNYLLQRLEHYQGIVLVTTNLGDNIDPAFRRRMDVVVNFVPPEAEERWQIWQLHLPGDHAVGAAFLEQVAVRCRLNGGQIRNAVLYAALLALDEGQPVGERHLEQAVHSEYRKAGAICPLEAGAPVTAHRTRVASFVDAIV